MGISDIVIDDIPFNPMNIFYIGDITSNIGELFESWSSNPAAWTLNRPRVHFDVVGREGSYKTISRSIELPTRVVEGFRNRREGVSLGFFKREAKLEALRDAITEWLLADDQLDMAYVELVNELVPVRMQAIVDNRKALADVPVVRHSEELWVEFQAGTMFKVRMLPPDGAEGAVASAE